MGHSRLGKTALWAGAQDQRFAIVISNDSGEGGAALSRRRFGETIRRINTSFPHWFCTNLQAVQRPRGRAARRSAHAPGPDRPTPGADLQRHRRTSGPTRAASSSPAKGADPVYRLLGTDGLAVRDMPGTNVLVWSTVGYHIRPGKHDVTPVELGRLHGLRRPPREGPAR